MVSINTNLQSLIVQHNLTQSTNALNTAIERMTTGYKINSAKDNAAGYSIAQDITSKLSSYDIAADNILAGIDLLNTAQDTISLMQTRGERLMSLWTQAQNGTYGSSSLSAINEEASAIITEINRLVSNTEYNGMKLLERDINLPDWAETVKSNAGVSAGTTSDLSADYDGFIANPKTYTDAQVAAMTTLSSISSTTTISSGTYSISSKSELEQLATMVNSGLVTGGTFVLGDDIDLEGEEWTAIGEYYYDSATAKWIDHRFKGTFDGNGHTISRLTIKPEDGQEQDYQGLFGFVYSTGAIKNVGIVDADVKGKERTGALVGYTTGAITNSYATGSVTGTEFVGGLVGNVYGSITNSCSTGNVYGETMVGGLIGGIEPDMEDITISDNISYSIVNGTGITGSLIGGIVGFYEFYDSEGEMYYSGGPEGVAIIENNKVINQNLDAIYLPFLFSFNRCWNILPDFSIGNH